MERSFGGVKKKKSRKSKAAFCSARTLKSFFQQTHIHQHIDTFSPFLSLTLSLSLFVSFPSFLAGFFISFIFTLSLLQGSLPSPSTYHSFSVHALISASGKINSVLWIYFSSYRRGFISGNKAGTLWLQLWLTSICYSQPLSFPQSARERMHAGPTPLLFWKKKKKKTWNERECSVGFPQKVANDDSENKFCKERSEREKLPVNCVSWAPPGSDTEPHKKKNIN